MTEMTLQDALAEVKSGPPYAWGGYDTHPRPHWRCTDAIIKAVASGAMIPLSDHQQAVAMAYQRAADQVSMSAPGHWLVVETDRVKAAILALAPADAMAEVQALRAEVARSKRLRDQYREALDAEREHSNPAREALQPKAAT